MQFQPPQSVFLPKESIIPYQLHNKIYGSQSNSYREYPNFSQQALKSPNISEHNNQNPDPIRISHRSTNHRIQQLQGIIKTLTSDNQHIQNLNSAADQVKRQEEQNQFFQQPASISQSYSQNKLVYQMQMNQSKQESSASSQYQQQYNTQNSNNNLEQQYSIKPSPYTKIQSNNIDLDRSAQNSARSFQVLHNDFVRNRTQFKTTQKSATNLNNFLPNQKEKYTSHSPVSTSSSSSHSSTSSTSKSQNNRKTKNSSHHQRHHSNKKKNIDSILLENCCQLVKEVSLSRGLMELFSLTVGSGEHFRRLFLQKKYSDALLSLFSLVLPLIRMNPAGVGTGTPGIVGGTSNLASKNSFFEPHKQKDNYTSQTAYNQTDSQNQNLDNQRVFEAQNQGYTQSRVFPISSCHVFGSDQQEFCAQQQRNIENTQLQNHQNQFNQGNSTYQKVPIGKIVTNSQSFHDQQQQYIQNQGQFFNKDQLPYKANSNHQHSKEYDLEESQQESQQQGIQYLKHQYHEPQWELYNAEFSNNKHFNGYHGNTPSMTSQDFDDDSSNQKNYKINNPISSKQTLSDQNSRKVKEILQPTHPNSKQTSSNKSELLLQKKSALSSESHIHQNQQQYEELDQDQESCCSKHCVSQNIKSTRTQKRLEGNLTTPNGDKKHTKLLTNSANNNFSKTIHLMPCMKGRGDKSPTQESSQKSAGDKIIKRETHNLKIDTGTNSLKKDYLTKESDNRYNKHTNNSSFSENHQVSKTDLEEDKKKKNIESQPRWKQ